MTEKIKEGAAKRILRQQAHSKNGLSKKDYMWDVPIDLSKTSEADCNRWETFIGIGRWKSSNATRQTRFVLIAKRGELIYLEPKIVEIIYNSLKEGEK